MMTIVPYEGIDDLKFSDTVETIKKKLSKFKNIRSGNAMEMGKKYPSLNVGDAHLYIVFYPDTQTVRYFQVSGPISHNGKDLFKTSIEDLTETYTALDPALNIEFDGFNTVKFGFSVNTSEDHDNNDVLVYSRQYGAEPKITADDILKHYGTKNSL